MTPVPPVPDASLPVGARVGGYAIDAVLSHGDFAVVYRATDQLLLRKVALKEYFPRGLARRIASGGLAPGEPGSSAAIATGRQAFIEEARLLARLDVPGLLRVLGVFEANQTVYRVMPLVPGATLAADRKARGIAPDEAGLARWLQGLLETLDGLHANGLVHGYLQPEQVMLVNAGEPLLLGFGTVRRALHGTLDSAYAAIEQSPIGGQLPRGAWTDLHALAAVAWYCVTGRPPMETERARLLPVSSALAATIAWALTEHPAQRPQSVVAFRTGLAGEAPAAVALMASGLPPAPAAEAEAAERGTAKRARAASEPAASGARSPLGSPAPLAPAGLAPAAAAVSVPAAAAALASAQPAVAVPPPAAPRPAPASLPLEPEPTARAAAPTERARIPEFTVQADEEEADPAVRAAIASMLASFPPTPPRRPTPPPLGDVGAGAWQPMPVFEGFEARRPPAAPPPRTAEKRTGGWAWAGGALLLAGVAVVAWQWQLQRGSPVPREDPAVLADRQLIERSPLSPSPPASVVRPVQEDVERLPPPAAGQVPAPTAAPAPVPVSTPPAAAEAPPPVSDGEELVPPPAAAEPARNRTAPAPATGPRSPREACAGRSNFSLDYCLEAQCRKGQFSAHPQCRALRESGDIG